MSRKRYTPEQIIGMLREAEVALAQGEKTGVICRRSETPSFVCTWSIQARRREGLKVPGKQPKRGRLWLNDGSCIRLRAERPNHVWSYDFVMDRTHDGRAFRMLTCQSARNIDPLSACKIDPLRYWLSWPEAA
jgi:hypothetical protein